VSNDRLEAFSHDVIAILIDHGTGVARPHGTAAPLREDMPVLLAHVLTFVNIGIAGCRLSSGATAGIRENHFPPNPAAAR
jgi:hypothetical protein